MGLTFRAKVPVFNGMRAPKGGDMQTAVHRFTRRFDQRTVVLVGTVNTAEVDYFAELNKLVNEYIEELAPEVHYEGILDLDKVADMAATVTERAAVQGFDAAVSGPGTLAEHFGLNWTSVDKGIPRAPEWRNTDVRALDLLRMAGPSKLAVMGDRAARQVASKIGKPASTMSKQVFLAMLRKALRGPLKVDHMIHVDWRNIHVMCAVLDTPKNAIVLYGAGHLAGMGDILARNDFRLTSTDWYTAVHADR